ncbi:hypothetical protein E4U40_004258, partial [Claviceps sp. LM458 group G5]
PFDPGNDAGHSAEAEDGKSSRAVSGFVASPDKEPGVSKIGCGAEAAWAALAASKMPGVSGQARARAKACE